MTLVFHLRRWFRSQRFLVVLALFVFSGVTAPLLAANLADILASLDSDQGIAVVAADPTWESLLGAYFKNASQLVLLVVCFVVGSMVHLGPTPAHRIHYLTRVSRRGQLLLPRLLSSVLVVSLGAVCGAGVALYETTALVGDTQVRQALLALGVQSAGMILWAAVAGALAFATGSPFISALAISGSVLISELLGSVAAVRDWAPTRMLAPHSLLDAGGDLADYARPAAALVVLVVVVVTVAAIPRTVTARHGSARPADAGGDRRTPQAVAAAIPTHPMPYERASRAGSARLSGRP
ncbi:hypothetical protein IDVR_35690 [Intrasporangium sp. DVR]